MKPCVSKPERSSTMLMSFTNSPWLPLPSNTCCDTLLTELKTDSTPEIMYAPVYNGSEPMSPSTHICHCKVHLSH